MDMPDVGIAASGTAIGVIGTIAAAWIKARRQSAARAVTVAPDPLRVEIQRVFATKGELRELDERWERRINQTLGEIRGDIIGLRRDLKDFNDAAEARTTATHRRIDAMKDFCALKSGGCNR